MRRTRFLAYDSYAWRSGDIRPESSAHRGSADADSILSAEHDRRRNAQRRR